MTLDVDYLKDESYWNKKAKQVIFTGQIDKLISIKQGTCEKGEADTGECADQAQHKAMVDEYLHDTAPGDAVRPQDPYLFGLLLHHIDQSTDDVERSYKDDQCQNNECHDLLKSECRKNGTIGFNPINGPVWITNHLVDQLRI